jgi:hypothetical protein
MKLIKEIVIKVVIILALVLVASSFSIVTKKEYFEGTITYKKSYKIIHPNVSMNYLEDNYGVKQVLIYKDGNTKRINLNKRGDTVNVLIFNAKNKRVYGTFDVSSDTFLTYSALKNDFESYKVKEIEKQRLNGLTLNGFQMDIFFKDKSQNNELDSLTSKYYYSKKYKLNPKFHEYIKDGFNNEVTRLYPYLILKSIENDNFLKIETKEMINIQEIKIDNAIFEIDKNKILEEM